MRQDKTIEMASIGPPRRVSVPVLVRDGKPCIMGPEGVEQTHSGSYSAPYNVTVTPYHNYSNVYSSAAYSSYNATPYQQSTVADQIPPYGSLATGPYTALTTPNVMTNQGGLGLNKYSVPSLPQLHHSGSVNPSPYRGGKMAQPGFAQHNLPPSAPPDYVYKLSLCT